MHKYCIPSFECCEYISCKNDWNLIISMENKNTWLRNGLELLTFQSLLQHFWGTFAVIGTRLALADPPFSQRRCLFVEIQYSAISKHCVIDVWCIFVVYVPLGCWSCYVIHQKHGFHSAYLWFGDTYIRIWCVGVFKFLFSHLKFLPMIYSSVMV